MDELDPRSRALLDEALPAAWPAPEVEERVLARLRAELAGPPDGGPDHGPDAGDDDGPGDGRDGGPSRGPGSAEPSATAAGGSSSIVQLASLAAIVITVVAGLAIIRESVHRRERETAVASASAPARETAPAAPSRTNEAPHPSTSSDLAEEPERPTPGSPTDIWSRSTRARAEPEPVEPKSIEAEVALIAAANSALAHGDAREVLRLLDRHVREIPSPQLVEEREALATMAACTLDASEASAIYERFAAARRGSAHLERVRDHCNG